VCAQGGSSVEEEAAPLTVPVLQVALEEVRRVEVDLRIRLRWQRLWFVARRRDRQRVVLMSKNADVGGEEGLPESSVVEEGQEIPLPQRTKIAPVARGQLFDVAEKLM